MVIAEELHLMRMEDGKVKLLELVVHKGRNDPVFDSRLRVFHNLAELLGDLVKRGTGLYTDVLARILA